MFRRLEDFARRRAGAGGIMTEGGRNEREMSEKGPPKCGAMKNGGSPGSGHWVRCHLCPSGGVEPLGRFPMGFPERLRSAKSVHPAFTTCPEAFVSGFLPCFAPFNHTLMHVRDASLTVRRILCGTTGQGGGRNGDENRGETEAKERHGDRVHEMRFEMKAETVLGASEAEPVRKAPACCTDSLRPAIGPKSNIRRNRSRGLRWDA